MSKYDEYQALARDPEVIAHVLHSRMIRLQEIETRFNNQIADRRSKLRFVESCTKIVPFVANGIGLIADLDNILDLRNAYRKALKVAIEQLEQERDNELAIAQNS